MNPTSEPPFGPNPVDGGLVYAWPTRRIMRAEDAPTVGGIYVDPDAVDPNEPGLSERIGRDLNAALAAGAVVTAIADFRPGRVNRPAAGESPPLEAAQAAPDAPGSTNAGDGTNDTAAPQKAAPAPQKGQGGRS